MTTSRNYGRSSNHHNHLHSHDHNFHGLRMYCCQRCDALSFGCLKRRLKIKNRIVPYLFSINVLLLMQRYYLGSAELISSHRQRVANVDPHSDDNDEKPPDFGQGKTKFPQELHHVFDEVAHSRPASCCIWKLGSYVIGSIDSLASTE